MEPPKKQRFEGLSEQVLREHISFAARALGGDGAIEITLEPGIGPIPIWKRIFAKKAPELELQFSAGHLGRDSIACLQDAFEAAEIEFSARRTKQRKELSRLLVRCPISDSLAAISAVNVLNCAATALNTSKPFLFSAYHRGCFRDDYQLKPEDPLEPSPQFVAGHRLGRLVGTIANAISNGGKSTKKP